MTRFDDYLEAARRVKGLLIVDVQPHDVGKFIRFDMRRFAGHVGSFVHVTALYNGEGLGWETEAEMSDYYSEIGIDVENVLFVEKEYAFFRDFMDSGASDSAMVGLAKELGPGGDVRNLDEDEYSRLAVSKEIPWEDAKDGSKAFYVPEDLAATVAGCDGYEVVGGAENECLKEILLLAKALDVKLAVNREFVY